MATEWFVLIRGVEQGPFSLAELKEAAAKGKISENLPVKKGADGNWFPAKQIKGLPPSRVVSKRAAAAPPQAPPVRPSAGRPSGELPTRQ